MFIVDGYNITLSRGDTGAIKITIETDYEFQTTDRVLFSIKNAVGDIVKQQAFQVDENKAFIVTFFNTDTDNLPAGGFSWDIRCVLHPYYDSSGNIVNGDQVITPKQPMNLQLLNVVGEV